MLASAVACSLALSGVAASEASARLTLRFSPNGISAMGKFHPKRAPRLRSAIHAFGRTSHRHAIDRNDCIVTWSHLGLRMMFANFGAATLHHTACSPSVGYAQSATIRGRHVKRWRTNRGLNGGASLDRLDDLYPNAEQHGRRWWLASAYSNIGEPGYYPIVAAGITRHRVRDFHLSIGAAGE